MIKPTFAKIVMFKPEEIAEIRKAMMMTQEKFARLFPVSRTTIKSWEKGRRNPYGPSSTILQQIKAYTDHVKVEKDLAFKNMMERNK